MDNAKRMRTQSASLVRYNFYELHYKTTEFNFGEFRLQTRIPAPIIFLSEDQKRDTHFFDSLTQHLLTGDKPIGRSEGIKDDRYVKFTSKLSVAAMYSLYLTDLFYSENCKKFSRLIGQFA